MKISTGDFGFRQAGLAPAPEVRPNAFVNTNVSRAAEGFGNLAQSNARVAGDQAQEAEILRREQQAEAKRIWTESKRAESLTIHATAVNDLQTAHEGILTGLQDGSIKKEDAPNLWAEKSKEITEQRLAAVDKANVEHVKAALIGPVGQLGRQVNMGVLKRAQSDIGTQLNATIEQLGRSAVTDPAGATRLADAAFNSLGPQSGMNPEQIGKGKQTFKEAAIFNSLTAGLNGTRTSYKGLQSWMTQVQENQDLDPAKKNALLNAGQSQMLHLQNVAQAAETRRLAGAERAIDTVQKATAAGIALDPKAWMDLQTKTRGTPYAGLVDGLMKAESDTQVLLSKPIPEQIATVTAAQAAATNGGGLKEKAYADRLAKTVQTNVTMLQQSPLAYAVQRQGADGTPLDVSNMTNWGDILANRLDAVDPLSKQHGVGKKLLMPEEAKNLAQILQAGSSVQAAQMFGNLRKMIRDDKAYRDTIAQISPDDPVTAYAGTLTGKKQSAVKEGWFSDARAPDPQTVAKTILDGRRLLAPTKGEKDQDGNRKGLFKMPPDAHFEAEFESATRGIYAGNAEARSIDQQAVRAYYAGKASDSGKFDGTIDSGIVREAVTGVLGGISDRYGRVVRPYGWPEDQFRDSVQKAWQTTVQAQGLPVQLKDARIRLRNGPAEGQYYVMDGTTFMSGKDGRPLTVNVLGAP